MRSTGRRTWRWFALCPICLWIETAPVLAQAGGTVVTARVVESSVGMVGQRRESEPLARVNSRIQNRVSSRLRQRIDRYYDPRQSDVRAQVETAQDQARTAGRPSPAR